jgi:hypothetical protein
MPRAGWVTPASDRSLSDHISIGVLTRVFPPALVDAVVAQAGRGERRARLLPARVVVYYVLAMALFGEGSYEEVMRQLTEGLAWQSGWTRTWAVPTKAAIFKARARLGVEPLELLFGATAGPLAGPATRGAYYRGLRMMSLDATCLDVADTPANQAAFGRPGAQRGHAAFPQLRIVGLCECGTHAITEVALGPCRTSEQALADQIIARLGAGTLCLADRGFYGFARFQAARKTGAELVWRVKSSMVLPRETLLSDGSYLTRIYPNRNDQRARRGGTQVRVIEYGIDAGGGAAQRYRLISTMLDCERAPAVELANLYRERWEIEGAFDEFKSHQRGPGVVLRSKLPEGVYQEAYGYLCTHYAIRSLMHDAALQADVDPDRLSFTRTLRAARRSTRSHPGVSPPEPESGS